MQSPHIWAATEPVTAAHEFLEGSVHLMFAKKSASNVQKVSKANNFAYGRWETLSWFVALLRGVLPLAVRTIMVNKDHISRKRGTHNARFAGVL